MKRIGVFGGAFDPPHLAHRLLAQTAIEQFALDQLRVIPTGQAWHKTHHLIDAHHRLEMARLNFSDIPRVDVDDLEIRRGGPSFTADTLHQLKQQFPQAQFWLFMGADQAKAFTQWHRWQEIVDMAHLVVAHRPDSPQEAAQWHNAELQHAKCEVQRLEMPAIALSATQIRDALADANKQAHTLAWLDEALAPSVRAYMDQHRLYRQGTHD